MVERAVAKRLQRLGIMAVGAVNGSGATGHDALPPARFDVTIGQVVTRNLPKRIAILTVVRGLVLAGVSPKEIESALHWRGSRRFRSAVGHLSSSELVSVLAAEDESRGKTFDPIRFFCEDGRLMFVHGRSYVFSSQWTGPDAKRGIETLAAAFPGHNVSFIVSAP